MGDTQTGGTKTGGLGVTRPCRYQDLGYPDGGIQIGYQGGGTQTGVPRRGYPDRGTQAGVPIWGYADGGTQTGVPRPCRYPD